MNSSRSWQNAVFKTYGIVPFMQTSFFNNKTLLFHGGQLFLGKRKSARPLCSKRPIHLTLKCNRSVNLFRQRNFIKHKIRAFASRFGVKCYRISVQGDHVHAVLRIHHRSCYTKFIRSLTGVLARRFGAGVWKFIPFTRVASWGRDFKGLLVYLDKNDREVFGLQPYEPRKNYYSRYLNSG